MRTLLTKGLTHTVSLWADVEQGYAWVHRVAHLLSNGKDQIATEVRQAYENLLAEMKQMPTPSEPLATMLSTFCKVTIRPLSLLRGSRSPAYQQ
jgi:hypothetical protein